MKFILSRYNCERGISWWRHQMETFSALPALCAGNSPVPGEFPAQRTVTRSFDVFFDLRLNKRLSKQSWGWWFETQSGWLWRHSNVNHNHVDAVTQRDVLFWEFGCAWWRDQIEKKNLRYWPFGPRIHRSSGTSPHKGQWHGALTFSLICARIK